jgi:hypothetical protein
VRHTDKANTPSMFEVAAMAVQDSGPASGLAGDPQAHALLRRVNQLVLSKLALPGGAVQTMSHRPLPVVLDDLSLLTELPSPSCSNPAAAASVRQRCSNCSG